MAASLVSPAWLAGQIESGNKDLRIFDTTVTLAGLGEDEYKRNHIEGAQFLSIFQHTTPTKEVPVNIPDIDQFQEYLRSLGVNNSSHVILYEHTLTGFAGPRAWWMLRYFGMKNVSLLDGGLKRWQSEGRPVTADVQAFQAGDVTLNIVKSLLASYDDVLASKEVQFVDSRPSEFYKGEYDEPSPLLQAFMPALGIKEEGLSLKTGHIPGAVNVPYPSLFKEDQVTLKSRDELLQLFQAQGVNTTGKIITTCYVGLTACIFALAANVCGLNDVTLYYGSWFEYGQRAPSDKVERTAKPAAAL